MYHVYHAKWKYPSSDFDSRLFDELHINYAPKLIGNGIPLYTGTNTIRNNLKLRIHQIDNYSNDFKITYLRDY